MISYPIMLIEGIYISVSLLQYLIAPRVRPNPYFGFRIGHTFSDTEVWKRANRFMGKLMFIHSILLIPFIFTDLLLYFLILFLIPLIGIIPVGIKYASNMLEIRGGEGGGEEEIKKISAGRLLIISPALIYIILLITEMFTYPHLPSVVAVHFNAAGKPDGWENRQEFIIYFSVLSAVYPILSYLYIYLGKKHPIYIHPGRMKFRRDAILKAFIIAMDMTGILLIYAYLSIVLYALYALPINPYILISLILILIVVPIVWLLTKGGVKNE